MADGAYGKPLIVRDGKPSIMMERLSMGGGQQSRTYDEAFIQKLAFDHPECLPISEIDIAYKELVPVCMELGTPAGPLDALYVTPTGRLVIVEAKLWRNPEARRKVVAQILDYAKELANWSYEDLQREVSKRLQKKGNVLFETVSERYPDTEEVAFVDGVQQSLSRGRFLLLIVGDGVREGAGAIAEFLESVGSLEFTFGLVELALFQNPEVGLLVQPRVLAKTVEFHRTVVVLPEGARIETSSGSEQEVEQAENNPTSEFYRGFWKEFLDQLVLDDVSQPMANVTQSQNIYFPLPPSGSIAWVSAYFAKSRETIGVYVRFAKGEAGRKICQQLGLEREDIESELSAQQEWSEEEDGRFSVAVRKRLDNVHAEENREAIKAFFSAEVNSFINTFRPRVKRIEEKAL